MLVTDLKCSFLESYYSKKVLILAKRTVPQLVIVRVWLSCMDIESLGFAVTGSVLWHFYI